ncbi:MAG: SDR family oxidoreductase [Verrucomicrobiota bacterium]
MRKPKVLLPAPMSYLGRRLLRKLLDRGEVDLRVLVADRRNIGDVVDEIPEIVEGDPTDPEVLRRAAEGIDVAFYPVRFIGVDPDFRQLRKVFPGMFRDACIQAGVDRIIYLAAYGRDDRQNAYLRQYVEIGEALSAFPDRIRVVWFRAGLILGSGSLLFEALRNLAQKVPVLPVPRWMEAKVTVIGVRDVLEYLIQAIGVPLETSVEVEIGLPPQTIREMIAATARVMGLRRVYFNVPITAPRLSPYILMVLTPYSTRMAQTFLRVLDTVGRTAGEMSLETGRRLFPDIVPAPFDVAVARAIDAIEKEEVVSRFTDSLGRIARTESEEEMTRSVFRDVRRESFEGIPPDKIFRAVKSIGGKHGWFRFDLLWRIRGAMDKVVGGYGASIGRRTETDLRVGDILDVWQVIDLQKNRRLLLEAKMKVAGKAWLEFRIEDNTLVQTAYHYPKGLLGRAYWYSMVPFHAFIFRDMVRGIVRQARGMD